MNKVYLVGNLTKDIEVRYTQSGKTCAKVGIAINQGYGDKKSTEFFNLVAWDKTADLMSKYLSKGSKILVEGRLQNNNYEDSKGVKRYSVDVVVDSVEFMDAKKKAASGNNYNADDDDEDMPF